MRPVRWSLVAILANSACERDPEEGCPGARGCEVDDSDPSTTTAPGNNVRLDRYPPVVVRTDPPSGALGVDPTLDRIEIEFSRPMVENGWSWVTWQGFPFPELGDVAFETPTVHAATGVVLEADVGYLAWLNSPSGTYESFVDESGNPAVAFPLAFHTGDDPAGLDGFPPAVIATDPPPGAEGVDPTLDRITVTFSRDMASDRFGWGFDAPNTFPETVGERFDDPRTAALEVALDPGTTYAVWINYGGSGFAATDGTPAATYLVSFRTAEP